ncbi:Serine/Threonine kinase domain protein (macronuclear) [Tetrahymena thermophila SB210]|uniref:Serine/Threonine kinase domain protein n=1 Tax=Tetrahymena thermophila (strain SB210) TaxID=312017 RepID=I7M198_TETTS|nr:Serine/Threonine kinase domain protein [Tetrahymena thermophila SB210]EAR95768.2 Serine/Threonine kinase domain protein [Tetrahymena thermophila SB210]|eukprot:XP_001016013.2 Serine/Threonine kinase domain protein [Tetrahymena thermophila SB210]
MSKNEKMNKLRSQLKGTIKKVNYPMISDRAEVVEKDREYQIYYIPGNFSSFFEELDILGEGCVGLVKKVKRISDGELFACKMVKLKDEETVLQVIREFKNIKKLNHPNIVRVYELYVDEIKRRIYTIMELVEASEMFEVIRKLGSYSEEIASRIFKQILSCIRYMHESCVCHRDLKPNNILSTEDGQCVKITDFNISKFGSTTKKDKFFNKNVKMWTYTGTVSFSAPEVFSEDEYDQSVDIWSAGVVLYTMLSGQEPFQAEYLQDLIAKIQNADYQFQSHIWSAISDEAKDLIQKCLILNPKERITPDQALLHPWITGKQNTSPLALIIFNNFENNARRLSKKVHAYQKLGLIKPVSRKISIDYSILQRTNHHSEQEFSQESPYSLGHIILRKDSGNSKQSTSSQNRNYSSFYEACLKTEQCKEESLPAELLNIQQVESPTNDNNNSPPKITISPLKEQKSNQSVFFKQSITPHICFSDQVINRHQKSQTFSEEIINNESQNNTKIKRIQSLYVDEKNINNQQQEEEEKGNDLQESYSSKKLQADPQFSRFARSQKTHKTLILHDRYKLNEEEQFLLSQNQFSEQFISTNTLTQINQIQNFQTSYSTNLNQQTNPSLIFIGESLAQKTQQDEGVIEEDPIVNLQKLQVKPDQNRKKVRHFTVNDQVKCYQYPK